MIPTNQLPEVGFTKTDSFLIDASAGTGRLTGDQATEFFKEAFLSGASPTGRS